MIWADITIHVHVDLLEVYQVIYMHMQSSLDPGTTELVHTKSQ